MSLRDWIGHFIAGAVAAVIILAILRDFLDM